MLADVAHRFRERPRKLLDRSSSDPLERVEVVRS
jgi:hypothetical protein